MDLYGVLEWLLMRLMKGKAAVGNNLWAKLAHLLGVARASNVCQVGTGYHCTASCRWSSMAAGGAWWRAHICGSLE